MTTGTHKFETAGLGKAPFTYTGSYELRGPIKIADGSYSGAPGQPMGTCQYCSQGIAICCQIRSSDGREFIVGSDCVLKVGDAGLTRIVKAEVNARKREMQKARDAKRIAAAVDAFEGNREIFATLPHPRGFTDRQTGAALTLADQVDWMLANSGNAGKVRTARVIEKIVAR